ncbi:hypothetical protein [Microvirga lotononidis]|nr:hypothetical protein [Microvirga lotononidis]WQO32090.1 hypothetical protein U0023_35410 [Microvirga lotononidis]
MIHDKAIDRASEDDRVWFDANPDRHFRIRDLIPYEFNERMPDPQPGFTLRTFVAQMSPGVRLRLPCEILDYLTNETATDAALKTLFRQIAPVQFKQYLQMKKGVRAAKKARKDEGGASGEV